MKSDQALTIQAQKNILPIRGHRVMLDFHLAELYGVETRALKQAVRRNIGRFPEDFMFDLNEKEVADLLSQNVIPARRSLVARCRWHLPSKAFPCCRVFSEAKGLSR